MHELINLTPHPIVLIPASGEHLLIPPSGQVARVDTMPAQTTIDPNIPVPVAPSPTFGDIVDIPPPQPGKAFIVSALVLARVRERTDVFAPGTGPKDGAARDPKGQVIGVTRLIAAP